MYFGIFLIALNAFKLWLTRFLPLLGDEAYYNVWSKHLALSYVDHPPMIAYLNLIFGWSQFGIRLGAIISLLIATWLIYLVAKEAFGRKVGIASAFLFNLIPTYLAGGLFFTPEQPFIIFWLLSMYAVVKIIKTQEPKYWYLLGLGVGLGMLSKYPMILFAPGLLVFLFVSKDNRSWLSKKEPYLAALLATALLSPVIIWNIQHSFPSLAQHGARLHQTKYFDNILYFFGLQFIMFSPPLFIFALKTFLIDFWVEKKLMDSFSLFFILISLVPFAVFLLVSPFTAIGGHWTSTAYLGILIFGCYKILNSLPNPLKNTGIRINLAIIILINALAIAYYAFLYPIPAEFNGKAYSINYELPQFIKDSKVDYVFSNQMGVGSLIAFYGKTEVYLFKGQWPQFDIWGRPQLKKGNSILYFAFDETDAEKKLKTNFRQVKKDSQKRLFTKDSDIPLKVEVYRCE